MIAFCACNDNQIINNNNSFSKCNNSGVAVPKIEYVVLIVLVLILVVMIII